MRRALYLEGRRPGRAATVYALQVELRGALDRARLERAFAEVVGARPRLRIGARGSLDTPQLFVASGVEVSLRAGALEPGGGPAHDAERRRRLGALRDEPFDLARPPLVRACLLTLGPERHALQVAAHALAVPALGLEALLDDVLSAYAGLPQGSPFDPQALPVVPRPARRAEDLEWWRARLTELGAALPVPPDLPRPPARSDRRARARDTWDAEILEGARERLGLPDSQDGLRALLAAAFGAVLFRQDQAQRLRLAVFEPKRGPQGMQVNLHMLELELARALRLDALARTFAADLDEARRRRAVDAVDVAEALAEPGCGFGEVGLEVRPPSPLRSSYGPLEVGLDAAPARDTPLALHLSATPADGGLEVALDYAPELYTPETALRLLGQTRRVVHTLKRGIGGLELGEVSILTTGEHRALARPQRGPALQAPPPASTPSLPGRVYEVARQRPTAVALRLEAQALTYGDLERRARALADRLWARGVRPGDRVAVLLERSFELVTTLLAVLELGAAYVPLDPDHPPPRLEMVLEDAEPALLVTTSERQARLQNAGPVLALDRPSDAGEARGAPEPAPPRPLAPPGPDALAYVIYTSGSTGRPKGVEIPHGALDNLLAAFAQTLASSTRDRWLGLTTIAFDIAMLETFLPLSTGAELVLVPPRVGKDPVALRRALEAADITHAQATPSAWRLLVEAGWAGDRRLTLLCGGEALPRELADALLERAGAVFNVYGPTETTIWSTIARVSPGAGPVPIGSPLPNTSLYVVDEALAPVPVGVAGELLIGGSGLARGYHRRPALTAERFVLDPFSEDPEARVFKTGDLVRRRPDGQLVWLARKDQQVKVRGHRIELGEIEAVLLEHPAVEAAAVIVVGAASEARLVAFVTAGPVDIEPDLIAHVGARLPRAMVPGRVLRIEQMPLGPSGKIDRRALARWVPPATERPPAPRGDPDTEGPRADVARIWARVLERPDVPHDVSLEALGADSIQAVRIARAFEGLIGRPLELSEIYARPTVEAQAELLSEGSTGGAADDGLVPLTDGEGAPLYLLCGVQGFRPLAEALQVEMSPAPAVFGVLAPSELRLYDPAGPGELTFERLAAEYVEIISAAHGRGPLRLAGSSFGGALAVEAARQLAARGRPVQRVVVLDTELPGARRRSAAWPKAQLEALVTDPDDAKARLRRRVQGALRSLAGHRSTDPGELRDAAQNLLLEEHVRRRLRYPGDLLVVRAADEPLGPGNARPDHLGWRPFVQGKLTCAAARGSHTGILEWPHVRALARLIAGYIEG